MRMLTEDEPNDAIILELEDKKKRKIKRRHWQLVQSKRMVFDNEVKRGTKEFWGRPALKGRWGELGGVLRGLGLPDRGAEPIRRTV